LNSDIRNGHSFATTAAPARAGLAGCTTTAARVFDRVPGVSPIQKLFGMRMIESLEECSYYHIYNRGINGEDIFRFPNDYRDFMDGFREYTEKVLDVFAYALMKNHFHSLVHVKEEVVVERNDGKGLIKLEAYKQLGHFFNSYAQSFNRSYDRTGSLFEKPFKRKSVDPLNPVNVVMYIHNNPQHHGFVQHFQEWPHSSYDDLIGDFPTFLQRETVLKWFGGRDRFIESHGTYVFNKQKEKWIIE